MNQLIKTICLAAAATSWVAGCIVNDELTTITIRPDGSADWVRFQSNIRSTEAGRKGEQELKKFVADFDSRTNPELARVIAAGGEILDTRWLDPGEPSANVVRARFPTAAALEKFATIRNDNGEAATQARFTQAGNRRKLSVVIPIPPDTQPAEQSTTKPMQSFQQFRKQQANAISETRVVIAGGQIVASQGFLIANDKRSCLLDAALIEELLRGRPSQVELFIEWQLTEK